MAKYDLQQSPVTPQSIALQDQMGRSELAKMQAEIERTRIAAQGQQAKDALALEREKMGLARDEAQLGREHEAEQYEKLRRSDVQRDQMAIDAAKAAEAEAARIQMIRDKFSLQQAKKIQGMQRSWDPNAALGAGAGGGMGVDFSTPEGMQLGIDNFKARVDHRVWHRQQYGAVVGDTVAAHLALQGDTGEGGTKGALRDGLTRVIMGAEDQMQTLNILRNDIGQTAGHRLGAAFSDLTQAGSLFSNIRPETGKVRGSELFAGAGAAATVGARLGGLVEDLPDYDAHWGPGGFLEGYSGIGKRGEHLQAWKTHWEGRYQEGVSDVTEWAKNSQYPAQEADREQIGLDFSNFHPYEGVMVGADLGMSKEEYTKYFALHSLQEQGVQLSAEDAQFVGQLGRVIGSTGINPLYAGSREGTGAMDLHMDPIGTEEEMRFDPVSGDISTLRFAYQSRDDLFSLGAKKDAAVAAGMDEAQATSEMHAAMQEIMKRNEGMMFVHMDAAIDEWVTMSQSAGFTAGQVATAMGVKEDSDDVVRFVRAQNDALSTLSRYGGYFNAAGGNVELAIDEPVLEGMSQRLIDMVLGDATQIGTDAQGNAITAQAGAWTTDEFADQLVKTVKQMFSDVPQQLQDVLVGGVLKRAANPKFAERYAAFQEDVGDLTEKYGALEAFLEESSQAEEALSIEEMEGMRDLNIEQQAAFEDDVAAYMEEMTKEIGN